MRVIQSPADIGSASVGKRVFLAGTIDMGNSHDWQSELIAELSGIDGTLFNPRRDAWDASWKAEASFPLFAEQVRWEIAAMEAADLIAFYFAPGSQSPTTLLELGLAARTGKAVVCCPTGYWRKGNVDIVCQHFGVATASTLRELADSIAKHCGGRGL